MHDTASVDAFQHSRTAVRMGGWSFIVAALGFIAVFSYLAATFNYPVVLDGSAAEVLPELLALGTSGRAVWIVYSLIPILLIPAAIGAQAALQHTAPNAMRAATVLGTITAVSMFFGLARWPSVHWELARAYASSSPDAQEAMDAVFRGLNVYLGNFVGEFLGELSLNGFFLLSAYGLLRAGYRRMGVAGMFVAVIGLIAAARNATSAVAAIAEINNYLLPVWLVALGVFLLYAIRSESARVFRTL